jgi:hypothetical protein
MRWNSVYVDLLDEKGLRDRDEEGGREASFV